MTRNFKYGLLILFAIQAKCVKWGRLKCSHEIDDPVVEGIVDDIGKFPWLGMVVHNFYLGGKIRSAMTSGVLIHPRYALAPAEDITKITPEILVNTTSFILYRSKAIRYIISVLDYSVHPEFASQNTVATLTVLELDTAGETGLGENKAPVYPICLPLHEIGTFQQLYIIKFTDERGDLEKTIMKMKHVEDSECEEFYYTAKLDYKKKSPISPICAVAVNTVEPCLWEAGSVLVSNQWGFWRLIGFGMRGPGCGAPARFANVYRYMTWIEMMVTPVDEQSGRRALYIERQSPVKIHMYPAIVKLPPAQGQCERKIRGNVIYKDSSEVLMSKTFGQGFFYLELSEAMEINCLIVKLETQTRSNAVLWLEHNCNREMTGNTEGFPTTKLNCFYYYTTTAFLEFRFTFSFRAVIEVTIYGKREVPKRMPNPFAITEFTEAWKPTKRIIRWKWFVAYASWWYNP